MTKIVSKATARKTMNVYNSISRNTESLNHSSVKLFNHLVFFVMRTFFSFLVSELRSGLREQEDGLLMVSGLC